MKKTCLIATSFVLILSSSPSLGYCDFHDNSRWGAFARHHELGNQNTFVSNSNIKLKHEELVTTAVNQPSSVNIDYRFPFIFTDVTLEFVGSDGLEIDAKEAIAINRSRGKYALSYTAQTSGEHEIVIHAKATKNGSPYALVNRIKVTAI